MSDEYQLRKDIDFVINFANKLRANNITIDDFLIFKDGLDERFEGYYSKEEIDRMTDKSEQSIENNKITILALGLPYFEITDDGNLELEESLGTSWVNHFSINTNGELIYSSDELNNFHINENGELIYGR